MPEREKSVQYSWKKEATNVGKRLKKFKTKTEADASKYGKQLVKEAGGAAKRTLKKAASYVKPKTAVAATKPRVGGKAPQFPKSTAEQAMSGGMKARKGAMKIAAAKPKPKPKPAVRSPARNIPSGKQVQSPAQGIPRGKKTEAVQSKYNKNITEPMMAGETPTLARGGTVSETRGLQSRTTRGPEILDAPDYVKTIEGVKNPFYDPEALRPGRRRTETGYFTDAPPPHLTITPFDTAEERAAKQKGLESWYGGTSEFHTDQAIGRQSGLRERALAHVKGKYGLEEQRIQSAGRITEQQIASSAAVTAAGLTAEGRRTGPTIKPKDTIWQTKDEDDKPVFHQLTEQGMMEIPIAGQAEMPDFVAQFREGKIKSMDELAREMEKSNLSSQEYKNILLQLTPSQQRFLNDYFNERGQ